MKRNARNAEPERLAAQSAPPEPIAIIGIGCRYAGASSPEELWRLLIEGQETVGPYPSGRSPDLDAFYAEARRKPGRILTDRGGFLEDVTGFDSQCFEISPREALHVDPQHRLLLEVAWEALEDAGQLRENYEGSATGVYTGLWTSEYESLLYDSGSEPDFYSVIGCGRASASGRISFAFGLQGPSLSVDAACSSSLVAVHMSCQALWSGEIDMALAGGANLMLGSEITELFTRAKMLSPEGSCKFGDASANGFVRSEGAGIVVLKRLSRAIADRDRIYAEIRGGAVNNDGRSSGLLMTPSRAGQREMLRLAWRSAGVRPEDLRYLELHGTGTGVGDPVEIEAAGAALAQAGISRPCAIGSVKTNIGHTESAAGVAGLIKTALVVQHRAIPASLHFKTPNPKIPWDKLPVRVASEPVDLSGEPGKVLAGVSSFGLTGTNAHLVLAEANPLPDLGGPVDGPFLLPISARAPEALQSMLTAYEGEFEQPQSMERLRDICYTAGARRDHREFRTAVVGGDWEEFRANLAAAAAGENCEYAVSGRSGAGKSKIVFVAPGQGSQWPAMARELYDRDPAFRQTFDSCDAAVQAETGWRLKDRILGSEAERWLTEIDTIQPALFVMSVSLAAVWRSWGIEPDAVVGHSMGEVAAAHIASVLNLEDAVRIICRRSHLMKTIRSAGGGMAAVEMPLKEVEKLLASRQGLSVGASNGPNATVISGDAKALEALLNELAAREVYCRSIKVDVASHSAQVDPILKPLLDELSGIAPKPAQIPMISTVTGEFADSGKRAGVTLDAQYWAENLRRSVQFAPAIERLVGEGYGVFVELSPHPILLPSIETSARAAVRKNAANENGGASQEPPIVVASLRREKPARATLLLGLGTLYAGGLNIHWDLLYPGGANPVRLPQYAFQRERCWPEPGYPGKARLTRRSGENALLGRRFESSLAPGVALWETELGIASPSYLNDHRVLRSAVFPAAGYVAMALAAAQDLYPGEKFEVRNVTFERTAYLPEEGTKPFQLALLPDGNAGFRFEIRSRGDDGEDSWPLRSRGKLQRVEMSDDQPPTHPDEENSMADILGSVAELQRRYPSHRDAEDHYRRTGNNGLQYGPAFRLVREAWAGESESLCRLSATADGSAMTALEPPLLDACFQATIHLCPDDEAFDPEATYLPVSADRIRLESPIPEGEDLFVQARRTGSDAKKGTFRADLRLFTSGGRLVMEVFGMEVRRVAAAGAGAVEPLYTLEWPEDKMELRERAEAAVALTAKIARENWVIFADTAGVTEELKAILRAMGGRYAVVRPGAVFEAPEGGEFRVNPASQEDMNRLMEQLELSNGVPTAVLHLWSLDARAPEERDAASLVRAQVAGSQHVPLVVQAVSRRNWPVPPRLWMVTAGAVAMPEDERAPILEGAPMWGIGRVAAREHPELQPSLVDLSAARTPEEARALAFEVARGSAEDRVALRGQKRYLARVAALSASAPEETAHPLANGEEYRIELSSAGILDNLELRAWEPTPLAADEVEIEIAAAGLNFIDITKAMGIFPGADPSDPIRLGIECAGMIRAAGDEVKGLRPGDVVLAINGHPGITTMAASRAAVPAELVFPKSEMLTFEQAATTPIAYLTAYYSLVELAKVRKGDWILIHSAAGGVGLAAVEIARWAGAKIIATAGSPTKREYLQSLGIEHVLDSRSSSFAAAVLEITGGRGVDIVLNSLAGELQAKSLEVLAPYGRFVELGKKDIYDDRQVGLKIFRNNISFHAVDLAAALEERRPDLAELLRTILRKIESGEWRPLPVETFSAADPAEPFRYMAQARHIGKIAIRMDRDVRVLPASDRRLFSKNASYVIAGGLGGVGLTVAEWMARNGAGQLALLSRRPPSEGARQAMDRIREQGAKVLDFAANVANEADLARTLAAVRTTGLPIRGVMHAAAAIDDALLMDLTPERFSPVFDSKIAGTWNLDRATAEDDLDFFTLFSSIAAVHPQPGMGSYAAGNAFLDAFSYYRRAQGRPAASVNWGGWGGLGLARAAGTVRTLEAYEQEGMKIFTASEALAALQRVLETRPARAIPISFEWEKFGEFYGAIQPPPAFVNLLSRAKKADAETAGSQILARLGTTQQREERREILESYLQETLGRVLKLSAAKIDRERPLGTMGLDSLMGLELVRRLSQSLEIAVPATAVFNYPTIRLLAGHLIGRLHLDSATQVESEKSSAPIAAENGASEPNRLLSGLSGVSDEEALEALIGKSEVATESPA